MAYNGHSHSGANYPYSPYYSSPLDQSYDYTTMSPCNFGGSNMAPNPSRESNRSYDSTSSGFSGRSSEDYGYTYPQGAYPQAVTTSASMQPYYHPMPSASQYNPATFYPQDKEPRSPLENTTSKSRRKSNPSSSKSSKSFPCLFPGCESKAQFTRAADTERHMRTVHGTENNKIDCPYRWCGRIDEYGFTRKDHLMEHERQVHMADIPKAGRLSKGV